ncbi:phosphoadenosine phosphosulfate reductase family protein [Cupriavidus sp. TMH.W2]|uniref:phosphoadenosine phosphosulfate reductase domain-containing protein n=1 Tax=Cupriavidus sp. TMH.W2 TaxID=3434465 RepID=UPI003D7788F1
MDMSEIRHIVSQFRGCYQLPGNPERDVYLLPLSGGADSTALAIVMKLLYPGIAFEYIFTDTGAEEPEIYATLNELEKFLGKPITRIFGGKGLYELIEAWGGFLPSARDRWCTRALKLEPFREWLTKYAGIQKYMFVGIRADESSRIAFTLDEVTTEMPYIDLGVRREDVFRILQASVGIPRYYSRRVRSGCSCCPFQRRSERAGLLQAKPIEFKRAMSCEKLSPEDAQRHPEVISFSQESGVAPNWMTLPLPAKDRMVGRAGRKDSLSLFADKGVFVGAEFFFDSGLVGDEFIWHQRIVSYSSSLTGIKRQLQDRYKHLLTTFEAFHLDSADEVRQKVRFAIYYVQAPSDVFDPDGPTAPGTYTWHAGESFRQMEHVIGWSKRILHAEGMRQQVAKYEGAKETSWAFEQHESSVAALKAVVGETGQVVDSMWFAAQEPTPDDESELDERFMACPLCQL